LVKIDPTRIDDRIYQFAEFSPSSKFNAFRNAITVLLGLGGLDITDFDANIHTEIVKSHFIELAHILQIKSVNLCRLNKTIQEVGRMTTDIITQGIEITDHRSSIDLISVTVDNTIQTLTKLEQTYEIQINDIQNRISSIESIQSIQYQKHETILNEHQKIIELNTESIDLATSEITRIENIQTYQYETLLERVNTVETLHKKYVNIVGNMIHQLENNRKENSIQYQKYNTDCELYVEKCNQLTDRIKSIELQVTELNNYVVVLINFITHLTVFMVCILFIYINHFI
jgi:chromosome segregation ATPase